MTIYVVFENRSNNRKKRNNRANGKRREKERSKSKSAESEIVEAQLSTPALIPVQKCFELENVSIINVGKNVSVLRLFFLKEKQSCLRKKTYSCKVEKK